MNTIISLNKISKTYFQGTQRIEVLCGLNLDVKSSEAVAILGQSGTGKSTLLSLLAGLDVPDFGTVEVNKQDLSKLSQDKLSQFRAKNLGVIFLRPCGL